MSNTTIVAGNSGSAITKFMKTSGKLMAAAGVMSALTVGVAACSDGDSGHAAAGHNATEASTNGSGGSVHATDNGGAAKVPANQSCIELANSTDGHQLPEVADLNWANINGHNKQEQISYIVGEVFSALGVDHRLLLNDQQKSEIRASVESAFSSRESGGNNFAYIVEYARTEGASYDDPQKPTALPQYGGLKSWPADPDAAYCVTFKSSKR